jgi:hypothetical protein
MTKHHSVYELVWVDPFWGRRDHGLAEAPDLQAAIDRAPRHSDTDLVLDEVHGPDGSITGLAGPGAKREVCVLADREGRLLETTVLARTISEAFAAAYDRVGPDAVLRGLAVDGIVLRPDGDEDFWARTDLPTDWMVS